MKKRFTKPIITTIAMIAVFGLIAAACNHSDDSSPATTAAPPATTAAPPATTAAPPATTAAPPATTAAPSQTAAYTLTILHNNDGESKLLPKEGEFPGIARFIAELKDLQTSAKSSSDGVITLTSGDNFLASKELNISLGGDVFYDAVALSGYYDAMALGNHDFDFGPDVTERFISSFKPSIPFLSANTDVSKEPGLKKLQDEGLLAGSVSFEKGGQKIGVIGAITQSLPSISSPRQAVIGDVATAVKAEAAKLTANGVKIIILVSHLQGVEEELALVSKFSDIDVIIAGGGDELIKNPSDTCFNEQNAAAAAAGEDEAEPFSTVYPITRTDADGNDVLIVTGPGGYRCIGRLNIGFDSNGIAVWSNGSANEVSLTRTPNTDAVSNVEEPLTKGLIALDSDIVGVSQVDLDGRRTEVRTRETNVGNLLVDSFLWNGKQRAASFGIRAPNVAVTNGGGIRNDAIIAQGNVSVSDTFDIAPFSNKVVVMSISRDTFKNLMETTIASAPDAGGGFAQVGGFKIAYDLSQAVREIDRGNKCAVGNPGARVRSITLDDGTKVVQNGVVLPGAPVRLAITDFLANGGDCYPLGGIAFTILGLTYQQSLADYIRKGLNGRITSNAYPASGTGRITITQ